MPLQSYLSAQLFGTRGTSQLIQFKKTQPISKKIGAPHPTTTPPTRATERHNPRLPSSTKVASHRPVGAIRIQHKSEVSAGFADTEGFFRGIKVTDVALAVFAGGALFMGLLQWRVYHRMRHDSVVRDRAFVYRKDYQSQLPPLTSPGAIWIAPRWENSGATPAHRIWLQVNVEIRQGDLPPDFEFPDRWEPTDSRNRHPIFSGAQSNCLWGRPHYKPPRLSSGDTAAMSHLHLWVGGI